MKCPFCIKVCSKCGKILVANNDNFPKNKNGKYGYHSKCKECAKKHSKKYHEENKTDINKKHREYYTEHKDEINERRRQYHQDNKDEINKKAKKYYQDNKDKIKEKNKEYYLNNIEKISESHKQYYLDNADWFKEYRKEYDKKYYEKNREKILSRCKEYKKNNPDKTFNNNHKRRLREENQGRGITKEQWLEMMMFFEFKCAYSGITLRADTRTIDHIVPLNKNGEHEIWNLVPMFKSCNSSKLDKNMLDWYIQQEFYSEERLNKIYEWIEYAKNKYKK